MHKYMWKNFAYETYFITSVILILVSATTLVYCYKHTSQINIRLIFVYLFIGPWNVLCNFWDDE